MDPVTMIATAAGLGWASGMRLYAVMFGLGLAHHGGFYELPPTLEVLGHPAVVAVSGALFFLEFFADKLPAFDSLWDAVHTFIRIPAGALLAAGAVASEDPGLALAAALLGGTVAAGTHLAKAGGRALINTSPEPFSNWIASFGEDVASVSGLVLALTYPALFLVLLVLFFVGVFWLLPRLLRGLKRTIATLRRPPGRRV